MKAVRDREAQLRERHAQELKDKLAKGLAGQRLGKHTVPEGNIDVQLGEDLAESLRTLKPEGNLFKDRFLSMQQRALIEPRVPVLCVQGTAFHFARLLTSNVYTGRSARQSSRSMKSMPGKSSIANRTRSGNECPQRPLRISLLSELVYWVSRIPCRFAPAPSRSGCHVRACRVHACDSEACYKTV